MSIHFLCPFGHRLVVPDHRAGKKGRCPTCYQRVIVPVPNPLPSGKDKKDWDAPDLQTAGGGGEVQTGLGFFDGAGRQIPQGSPAAAYEAQVPTAIPAQGQYPAQVPGQYPAQIPAAIPVAPGNPFESPYPGQIPAAPQQAYPAAYPQSADVLFESLPSEPQSQYPQQYQQPYPQQYPQQGQQPGQSPYGRQ